MNIRYDYYGIQALINTWRDYLLSMADDKGTKIKTSISLNPYLYDWMSGLVRDKTFASNSDAISTALAEMKGRMEETHVSGLKVGKCPKCKMINPESSSFCCICGFPLTQDAQNKVSQYENQLSQILEVFSKLTTGDIKIDDIKSQVKLQEDNKKN